MIAVDAYQPAPAQVRNRELLLKATQGGFTVAQLDSKPDMLAFERRIGPHVDRMIVDLRLGMPSMITRFLWDADFPWDGMPQPTPVDYAQGDAAEVIKVALAWSRQ